MVTGWGVYNKYRKHPHQPAKWMGKVYQLTVKTMNLFQCKILCNCVMDRLPRHSVIVEEIPHQPICRMLYISGDRNCWISFHRLSKIAKIRPFDAENRECWVDHRGLHLRLHFFQSFKRTCPFFLVPRSTTRIIKPPKKIAAQNSITPSVGPTVRRCELQLLKVSSMKMLDSGFGRNAS